MYVGGVENSFALVPCFPRGDFNALCSRSAFEFTSSKLFGVVSFCLCSFLPHFCFGFRTTAKRFRFLYFAETVCFSLLLFVVTFVCSLSAKKEIARARNKLFKVCVPQTGQSREVEGARAQIGTKRRGCRMRENPYTQVRINKKNYRLLFCLVTGFACVCETAIIPNFRTARECVHLITLE